MLSATPILSMTFAKTAQGRRVLNAAIASANIVSVVPPAACSISLSPFVRGAKKQEASEGSTTTEGPITVRTCSRWRYSALPMDDEDGRDCFVPFTNIADPSFQRSITDALPSMGAGNFTGSARFSTYRQRRAVSGNGFISQSQALLSPAKARNTAMSAAVYKDAHFINGALDRAICATRTTQAKRRNKLAKKLAAQIGIVAAAKLNNGRSTSAHPANKASKLACKAAQ